MEIRVLRYFLTVAREESITRAAAALHITQPTLSRQLAELETETGAPLFRRGARRLTLTEEGLLLRRRAEEILALVDKTERELLQQEELSGAITIGCGEFAAVDTLAALCVRFRREHPGVRFEFLTATADVVWEQLEQGGIDIGLLLEPVDTARCEYIPMRERERWSVVMRKDDPLARKEAVTREDLRGIPLGGPMRRGAKGQIENWFGGPVDFAFGSNLPGNAAVMVQAGMGRYIAVESAFRHIDPDLIVTRPLSPEQTTASVLAWKRAVPRGRALEAFLVFLKQEL